MIAIDYEPLSEASFNRALAMQQKTTNARHAEVTELLEHHDKRLDTIETRLNRMEATIVRILAAIEDLKTIITNRETPA